MPAVTDTFREMLRTVLRNFNATVRMVDNFLLNTFHLIPHYYGILSVFCLKSTHSA